LVADALKATPSGRVVDARVVDGKVVVVLRVGDDAESATALWEGALVASTIASKLGNEQATPIEVSTERADGTVVDTTNNDWPANTNKPSTALDPAVVQERADALDAKVVSVESWAALGGAVEITVTSAKPLDLAAKSGTTVATLVGEAGVHAAQLVRIVDESGRPLVVQGWVPQLGGEVGWGLGWAQPGVESSAHW
jgi:hypothetical protein